MNKLSLTVTCALFCVTSINSAEFFRPRSPMIFGGAIQFPHSLSKVPDIRIYRGGDIITPELDNRGKKITYNISDDRSQNLFTIFIAEKNALSAEIDENTVKYWKVKPGHPYKFYSLILKEIVPSEQHNISHRMQAQQPHFEWIIRENMLPLYNGRIPDNAIRVYCDPNFVDAIRGGSVVSLPSIIMKPDLVKIAGSELQLHEKSAKMLLSSLDHDALHSHVKHTIKLDYTSKTVITLTA